MIYAWDDCYGDYLPFTETLEELHTNIINNEPIRQHLLAYIRYRGEKFSFIKEIKVPYRTGHSFLLGTFVSHGSFNNNIKKAVCRLYTGGNYNILEDRKGLPGNWYNPYKIQFEVIDFGGFIETMYFDDFCTYFINEKIMIIEGIDND